MQDADIFLKTEAGRDEIRSRSRGLSMAIRAILLMVDGQRNVAALRTVIGGSKAPRDTLEGLLAQGLIEARPTGMPSSTTASTTISTPRVATMERAAPSTSEDAWQPSSARDVEPAAARVAPHDLPLDLTLATIGGPSVSATTAATDMAEAPGTQASMARRYEHLYTMMNEIVRDFVPAHRRYFIQLKIERAGTADELVDLLDTVQAALARARGDAFANEVVARLRNAT